MEYNKRVFNEIDTKESVLTRGKIKHPHYMMRDVYSVRSEEEKIY